jgi:hypothetical protein
MVRIQRPHHCDSVPAANRHPMSSGWDRGKSLMWEHLMGWWEWEGQRYWDAQYQSSCLSSEARKNSTAEEVLARAGLIE